MTDSDDKHGAGVEPPPGGEAPKTSTTPQPKRKRRPSVSKPVPVMDPMRFLTTEQVSGFAALVDRLRAATPAQAKAAMRSLTPQELYALPRDLVEGWDCDPETPGTARYIRTDRLVTEWKTKANWVQEDIAAAAGVKTDAVHHWRSAYLQGEPDWDKRLPAPDDSAGRIKKPGDTDNPRGIPLFYPSTALGWLKGSKRITDDCYPHNRIRGGRLPPGRPAGSKNKAKPTT